MHKRNELLLEKRVQMQFSYEQGESQLEISKTVKCSRRSVQYAIERFATRAGRYIDVSENIDLI